MVVRTLVLSFLPIYQYIYFLSVQRPDLSDHIQAYAVPIVESSKSLLRRHLEEHPRINRSEANRCLCFAYLPGPLTCTPGFSQTVLRFATRAVGKSLTRTVSMATVRTIRLTSEEKNSLILRHAYREQETFSCQWWAFDARLVVRAEISYRGRGSYAGLIHDSLLSVDDNQFSLQGIQYSSDLEVMLPVTCFGKRMISPTQYDYCDGFAVGSRRVATLHGAFRSLFPNAITDCPRYESQP